MMKIGSGQGVVYELKAMQSAKDGTSCAPNSDLGADEIVSKVLLCRHSFQVFGLDPPRVIELPDLQRRVKASAHLDTRSQSAFWHHSAGSGSCLG